MTAPAKVPPTAALMPLPTLNDIFSAMTDRFGLSPRASQLKLAVLVRDAVASGSIACVEAPTGTGKTFGYLAGALDAQAHSGNPVPVVVATATVGLQEQILRHDIPRLAAVGAVDPRKVAVAKGRGRYFCPRTAALLEDKKMQDGQFDMFQDDKHVADGGVPIALDMLKSWRTGEWDGDRDNWPGVLPSCWESACAASSDTCVNRACEHFEKCPYMLSRQKLAHAQVVVANHDIVLADLAQRAEEQSTTALPMKQYALVFDEAHNLPEKAVATKRACARLTETDWLRKLEPFGEATLSTARMAKALSRSTEFAPDVFSVGAALLVGNMEALSQELESSRKFSASGTSSWGLGAPEPALLERVIEVSSQALQVFSALKAAAKAYADYAEEAAGAEKAFAVRMLAQTYKFQRQAKELQAGLELFCSKDRYVRWVSRTRDGRIMLNTQPLEGQDVLDHLLWRQEMPVVLVSATLRIGASFKRFSDKCGLPGRALTAALPPVFDYTRGYLHTPTMMYEPGEPGYEAEVSDKLMKLYKGHVADGMLVLFTSRESMRRIARSLPAEMAEKVLVQDHRPIPELVAQHKASIDAGKRSILMGLDSMAEGLDLPGRYCGHVVITRLPFAVPGDPVEEARRDHLGDDWFEHAYLADMLTMLIQAAGRLIRRESDHGVITVLDQRLTTKRYCKIALAALPGFTRGDKLKGYFDMAKAKGFDMTHGAKPKVEKAPAKLEVIQGGAAASAEKSKVATTAPVASTTKPAAAPVDALANLRRICQLPSSMHAPVTCSIETLRPVLVRELPFAKGPFANHEPEYLVDSKSEPCLPVGTPVETYVERQLPEASMLALRTLNLPWDKQAPGWLQVLSLRPDLLLFANVLRSHRLSVADARTAVLSDAECEKQLEMGFAGLGAPTEAALFEALSRIEADVLALMSESFRVPSKELLMEMPTAAQALARQMRQAKAA
jgi:ATP-dependent DNA helicase DinG